MADRWISDRLGSEVGARPDFLRDLHAELGVAWPAEPAPVAPSTAAEPAAAEPVVEPAPLPDTQQADDSALEWGALVPARPSTPSAVGSSRRGLTAVVAVVVLLGAAVAVFVATRGGDSDTTVAAPSTQAQPDTSAATDAIGSQLVPAATSDTGSTTTPAAGTGGHPTFAPACTERQSGAPLPSVDMSPVATLGSLQATPTFTIHLPSLANFEREASPASSVHVVDGGLLVVAHDYGESAAAGTSGSMLALIGLDGEVRWVRCLAHTLVWPTTLDPVQQMLLATNDEGEWLALSLADGSLTPTAEGEMLTRQGPPAEYPFVSHVQEFDEDGGPLFFVAGFDEGGSERWRDETLMVGAGEVFTTATRDGVGIALGCEQFLQVEPFCSGPHLRGYDPDDGTVRWDVPGARDVPFVDNGLAMVLFDDGYRMVSLADGSFVGDTTWPVGSFDWECCAASDYHWTYAVGGMVTNHDYQTVTVWFPAAMNLGSHDISLP